MILETASICLAAAIYFEAGGESTKGKIAVANVVMNRSVKDNYCDVVKAKKQFSWVPDVKRGKTPDKESRAWQESMRIARLAIRGDLSDPTKGATHFHNDEVSPNWASPKRMTTKIGGHSFYRLELSPLQQGVEDMTDHRHRPQQSSSP